MRIQAIRIEDVSNAEREIISVLANKHATEKQKVKAVMLMALLDSEQIKRLADLSDEIKANRALFDTRLHRLPHPSAFTRHHARKPSAIHKRNVSKLWCPNGYLPPKHIIY